MVTSTRPPSRLYFTALETRLLKIISISPRSAITLTLAGECSARVTAARGRRRRGRVERRLRHLAEVHLDQVATLLAGLDPRQVQQFGDELAHAAERARPRSMICCSTAGSSPAVPSLSICR